VKRVRALAARPEWRFFACLVPAGRRLGWAWWALLVLRAVLPALLAVITGSVVAAVAAGGGLVGPLVGVGVVFVGLQVAAPLHAAVSANLGSRVSGWLFDQMTAAANDPPGIAHLEDPELAADATVARDFDIGQTGPPMSLNVDFIANSLVTLLAGLVATLALFGFAWWLPFLVGGAWGSTHWLLRESAVWKDRNTEQVRAAQRDADYAYRLAVEPPTAKELRLFGLADWTVARFVATRRRLHDLQYEATKLRERSVVLAAVIVSAAGAIVAVWLWRTDLPLGRTVAAAGLVVGASSIAFGGLNWALDGAAAPVAAVERLGPAMATVGALAAVGAPAAPAPTPEIVAGDGRHPDPPDIGMHQLAFSYPRATTPIYDGLQLRLEPGRSLAIVGRNGAGKTTLAKLLCRLYDPTGGAITVDGTDLRALATGAWRTRTAAVFQDYVRFELSLRDNVDPGGLATDDQVRAALADAGATGLAELDTPLSKNYAGGTDLSGGQWQRVAIARALCAVRRGAGLVLLDEPTAQLDVRGEAEVFGRVLAATRGVTTVLVSHRFSTVRHAERICVLEGGRVVELGTHAQLMTASGRYRTMFDLQASRFTDAEVSDG